MIPFIEVTGLVGDENYALNTDDPQKMKITFYKDAQHTDGLTDTGAARTVTIKFRTKTDPKWIEDYPSYRWIEAWHVLRILKT